MAMPASAAFALQNDDTNRTERKGPYTGVVIIHGIGDEKRNETLEQALNALTFWFNQMAGLALRPYGAGRVWVQTDLTNDDDPDAESSCATLELEAPSELAATFTGGERPLRVEFREVWWARSFGIPPVGESLAWAGKQLVEELRILWPSRGQAGLTNAAKRAPAREIPQAVTYQPDATTGNAASEPSSLSATDRRVRRALLWAYDGIQATWKGTQLLALAPLVLLMILAAQLLRLFAFLPLSWLASFTGVTTAVTNVSLHWIGPLRAYLLDYTVSASMRQVFEREVDFFLNDENCERIVVIAHSMGTVIAYEGLATGLMRSDLAGDKKQITFICLAQALRRLWALNGLDEHRLRYVLPSRVRWLHFWARYDPVSVGPLNASILPKPIAWTDTEVPDPRKALEAHLDRCENVDVVNEDRLFTDHTTYWENLEQVVGPIALELVKGHPALEKMVDGCQATPDDVLRRRLRVATRRMTVMASGLATAVLLLVLDQVNQWRIGSHLRQLGLISWFINLLGSAFGANGLLGWIQTQYNQLPAKQGVDKFINHYGLDTALTATVDRLLALALAVVVMLIVFSVVGSLVQGPPPLEPAFVARLRRGGSPVVFILSLVFVGILVVSAVVGNADYFVALSSPAATVSAYNLATVALLGLGALVLVGIWLAALLLARQRQHWFWFLVILAAPVADFVSFPLNAEYGRSLPIYETFPLAAVLLIWGAWAIAISEWRAGSVLRGIGLLILIGVAQVTSLILPLAPAVLYGIWLGPGAARRDAAQVAFTDRGESWRSQRTAIFALIALFVDYGIVAANGAYANPASGSLVVLEILGTALAAAAWVGCLVLIVRQGRWAWLIGFLLGTGAAFVLTYLAGAVYLIGSLPERLCAANSAQCLVTGSAATLFAYGLAPALVAMVLVYGIWSLPVRRGGGGKPTPVGMPQSQQARQSPLQGPPTQAEIDGPTQPYPVVAPQHPQEWGGRGGAPSA